MPLRFWKKESKLRRPENDEDRKKLLRQLSQRHANGEINYEMYKKLQNQTEKRMTQADCQVVLQAIASGAAVVSAFAAAVAIPAILSEAGDAQHQNGQDQNDAEDPDEAEVEGSDDEDFDYEEDEDEDFDYEEDEDEDFDGDFADDVDFD